MTTTSPTDTDQRPRIYEEIVSDPVTGQPLDVLCDGERVYRRGHMALGEDITSAISAEDRENVLRAWRSAVREQLHPVTFAPVYRRPAQPKSFAQVRGRGGRTQVRRVP